MPHNIAHRKLGRVTEHRIALLRNQATALLRHERIETTLPKAKELRPFVEKIITVAKRGVADGEAGARVLTPSGSSPVTSTIRTWWKAVRDARAPLRRTAGRVHPHSAPRVPPGGRRGDRADRARRQRVQPERRNREDVTSSREAEEGRRRSPPRRGAADTREEGRRRKGGRPRLPAAARRAHGRSRRRAKPAAASPWFQGTSRAANESAWRRLSRIGWRAARTTLDVGAPFVRTGAERRRPNEARAVERTPLLQPGVRLARPVGSGRTPSVMAGYAQR